MNLKVLLPFQVLVEQANVLRIIAETHAGSFGLLPNRLDCVAALVPGILISETAADGETYMAVDGGIVVKAGADVVVSTRRAVSGTDLSELRDAVHREFMILDARERSVRQVMAKLETGFLHRFVSFQRE